MFKKIAPFQSWRICLSVKIRVFVGVRFERRKDAKKANLRENWSIHTLFWSILNITAKYHQNWSTQFRAIPFQSRDVFWDTVYLVIYTSIGIIGIGHCRICRIGITRGQYYWVLDTGCLSWYRSNPTVVLCSFLCRVKSVASIYNADKMFNDWLWI